MSVFNVDRSSEIEDLVEQRVESSDESEFSQSSPAVKHKIDQEERTVKKIKSEFDANEALNIYNIEEALKKEIYSPKSEYSNAYTFSIEGENYFNQAECFNGQSEYYKAENQIDDNLDNFDFENQFLQDCDLEDFKYIYGISSSDDLSDSNEKINSNSQYLINNNGNFLNTFYDRQFF